MKAEIESIIATLNAQDAKTAHRSLNIALELGARFGDTDERLARTLRTMRLLKEMGH